MLTTFQKFTHTDKERLDSIIASVYKHQDIDQQHVEYEREIINKVIVESPELFDDIPDNASNYFYETLDKIIELYNNAINNQESVLENFEKIELNAKVNNLKNYTAWKTIGDLLVKGVAPKMNDIIAASSFFSQEKMAAGQQMQTVDETLIIRMIEWASQKKVLSNKELDYLAELGYGFKKLNSFHENNVKRHLHTLINNGFNANI